ncbi:MULTISPECIES: superoxide dismutase [Cytobacillus]|uniref:superoxide dismutase n=1 Tax=Cytobacillus oceanisediminis 2691 TaxID=1196031 RepID=A0A160MEK0_9BACI|nr:MULTISPECIES: superoxide dismutase [Cytobacillus]MBY0154650.1 superoxide dismutase [Cytobacillus firmus]AND41294.1 superoxide dismutase [Cytobacillus oceanisediminis 2691]MCM3393869.1 superoxide dismutase [Cytobacillus oceanisediminis]MCM3405039.1 superoxide dismutase [Cytobacillus oceanisediminis]MCM3529575.1 superoxide dismutase [Cytobacillus oceanisediminis]
MSKMEDYIKEVTKWNKELRDFLDSEDVEQNDELWQRLDHFTEIMDGINGPLDIEALEKLQEHVDTLHSDMENYFTNRQQLGNIYINEPYISAGKHFLPPLPYDYSALEPHISGEIMRLHHDKHHQSYVDGLNKAEVMLQNARDNNDYSLVKHWSRELAFHGSGHYLHTIFWNNMSPEGGGKPSGALLKEINKYFGSFERFKNHFTEAAKQVEGVGWAILVWSPRARRLEILQSERHMLLTQWDTIPLLVLDVWEHAYYLQYKNNRGDYVKSWWNVVNWKDVEDRYLKASELKWKPF